MNRLNAGERLGANDCLGDNSGRYRLMMQGDGNLVLYEGLPYAPAPVWDTGTWNLPGEFRPTYAIMQNDGNFVLYNNTNVPAWASTTDGNPGAYIILQDDRNLVVYSRDNAPLWASNTPVPSEIQAHQKVDVGWGKTMIADATLFRNGQLIVDSQQQNNNWIGGLRGQILVVCVDAGGRAIWVSRVFQCATRCSVPDVTCASFGRQTFTEQFPAPVGQYTARLNIYQGDNPNYVNLRDSFIDGIKAAGDIVDAIKDVLVKLTK